MKNNNLLFLIAFSTLLVLVNTEYIYNGKEWVLQENQPTDEAEEGSGDSVYRDTYDDDEDYTDDNYSSGDGEDYQDRGGYSNPTYNDNKPTYNNNNDNYNNRIAPEDPVVREPYPPLPDDNYNQGGYDDTNDDTREDVTFLEGPTVTKPDENDDFGGSRGNDSPHHSTTSFFAKSGTMFAIVGGAVVGLLSAILCVMFVVYRMRKKDEGSYALDEPKRSPTANSYSKPPSREFYA